MRTIVAEVERILAGLDVHLKMSFKGTKVADTGLANRAYSQLLEAVNAGESLEEAMGSLIASLAELPVTPKCSREYLWHTLKACGHSVAAIGHHRSGNEVQAWQQACDATAESGCALAIFVSGSERKYKSVKVSTSGGNKRGEKNEPLKKFVLTEWETGGRKKAYPSAQAIAAKFHSENGNPPRRTLREFNSSLSINNIEKTFEVWIRKELEKLPIA